MSDISCEQHETQAVSPGSVRSWKHLVLIAVVLIGSAMSLFFLYQGMKRSEKMPAVSQEDLGKTEQQDSATTTEQNIAVPIKPKDRSGLAASMSPDGVWRLSVEIAGSPEISVEQSLVIRKLSGVGKKILASVVDDLNAQNPSVVIHAWEAAGWSPEGSTVYYSNRTLSLGTGMDELAPSVYGNELYAVAVKDAKVKLLSVFGTGIDSQKNGLLSVSPNAKRVAFLDEGSLYTAAFDGSAKRLVYTPKSGERVWQAMYDPTGTQLAGLVMEQKGEEYTWTAGFFDGKGGYTALGASINGGLLDWTKASGLAYLDMHPDGSFEEKLVPAAKE